MTVFLFKQYSFWFSSGFDGCVVIVILVKQMPEQFHTKGAQPERGAKDGFLYFMEHFFKYGMDILFHPRSISKGNEINILFLRRVFLMQSLEKEILHQSIAEGVFRREILFRGKQVSGKIFG